MAIYPIKMLKDENGTPFVPLISLDSIQDTEGQSINELLDKKLETTNLIAGTQIELEVDGNNITINSSAEGTKLINNLDQTSAGVGALDAAQGKILKESIPEVINNLTTVDSTKALSAHQGYVLAGRSVPVGGGTGQVLMKSADDDYSLTWGDAADSNAINDRIDSLNTIVQDLQASVTSSASYLDDLIRVVDYATEKVVWTTGGRYRGNITITLPEGYQIISVIPCYTTYGDRNFVDFNLYHQVPRIYYEVYCQYGTSDEGNTNFRVVMIKNNI